MVPVSAHHGTRNATFLPLVFEQLQVQYNTRTMASDGAGPDRAAGAHGMRVHATGMTTVTADPFQFLTRARILVGRIWFGLFAPPPSWVGPTNPNQQPTRIRLRRRAWGRAGRARERRAHEGEDD